MVLHRSSDTEKPGKVNKDICVKTAPEPSFGDDLMLNDSMNDTGLNYGSKRVIVYDNYAIFQATAGLSFNRSMLIGSRDYPVNA